MKRKKLFIIGFAYIALLICIFSPYLEINGESHNILYVLGLDSGDFSELLEESALDQEYGTAVKMAVTVEVICLLIVAVLGFVKVVLAYKGKRDPVLFTAVYLLISAGVLFANGRGVGLVNISPGIRTLVMLAIPFFWGGILFVGERFAEELTASKEKK